MAGWRAVDQEPVASRLAIDQGLEAVLEAIKAMAGATRPVVAACWQDEAYVDVPARLLERIAEVADLTVACAGRPRLPEDVCHVPIELGDDEGDEWSVVALSPAGGVALVAHEVAATLPADTVEGGRTFRYDVTDETPIVLSHARRLARAFGARSTPAAAARLAEAITDLATADAGERAGALTGFADRVHGLVDEADAARRSGTMVHTEQGGLAALADWLADAGPRSPALGLVVVRSDVRGVTHVLRERARAVGRLGDLIIDVPPDAAMIVLPGLTGLALQERADEVRELLTAALGGVAMATAIGVPAEVARRDLVGSLGAALAELRRPVFDPQP